MLNEILTKWEKPAHAFIWCLHDITNLRCLDVCIYSALDVLASMFPTQSKRLICKSTGSWSWDSRRVINGDKQRKTENIESQLRKFQPQIEATGACEFGRLELETLHPAVCAEKTCIAFDKETRGWRVRRTWLFPAKTNQWAWNLKSF